jgi:hypothetical protein
MGVPVELREQARSNLSAVVFSFLQILGLYVLYELTIGNVGNQILIDGFGVKPVANADVRHVMFAVVALRAISQIFWAIFVMNYYMPNGVAVGITLFNVVMDSFAILATLWNRSELDKFDYVIVGTFVFGILLERGSEMQRTIWKSRPGNKGKPHMSGLYSFVVYVNYTGYSIWRFALIAFSRVWILEVLSAQIVYHFITNDVAIQRDRNIKKYGEEFKRYYDSTPKLFPGVF